MKQSKAKLKRTVFIGAGNMTEAVVRGLLAAGTSDPSSVRVTDILSDRLLHFRSKYKVDGSSDNVEEVKGADTVVFAVKPQAFSTILREIAPAVPMDALIISIAAGVTIGTIERGLKEGARVLRVMPNAPALVGRGAAAFARGANATESDAEAVKALFGCVGLITEVAEPLLDAVTALSGSGPAYVFYLIEAMLKAGQEMGLPPDKAGMLAIATVDGAAAMLKETGLSPGDLIRMVASRGGTTEAALEVLRLSNTADCVARAILAARDRAKELSN